MKRILSTILALVSIVSVLSLSSCGMSEERIEEKMREFCYEYYVESEKVSEDEFEWYMIKSGEDKIGDYKIEYKISFNPYHDRNHLTVIKFKKISDAKKFIDNISPKLRNYYERKGSYVIIGDEETAVKGLANRIF